MFTDAQVKRFWSNVDIRGADECWVWKRRVHRGYGVVSIRHKFFIAHRLAYKIKNGDIPSDVCVMHKCDNPLCCNPIHLVAGTHQDNMDDMYNKNRYSRIPRGGVRKLTSENAQEARAMSLRGESVSSIARNFNISNRSVRSLLKWETYRDSPPPLEDSQKATPFDNAHDNNVYDGGGGVGE